MSQIETQYDNFVAEFGKNLEKVDTSLALQTMYFQRKFTDAKPKVDLRICYHDEADLEEKRAKLDRKFACSSTTYVRNYRGPECGNILKVELVSYLL